MLIDGKKIATRIQEEIKEKVDRLSGRKPGLAFILIGNAPSSHSYVGMKKKGCLEVGFHSTVIEFPETVSEQELLTQIAQLNHDDAIDGILVQQPLPKQISTQKAVLSIDPNKDVDGFHPLNIGKMLLGETDGFSSCTPLGIVTLLERSKIPVSGKHVVILGRSNIVGKPLAALLMQKKGHGNATVTVAHSATPNLKELCLSADVLVAAIGKPRFVKAHMVREGAVVIDVGINRLSDNSLVGDVDYDAVRSVASQITPVPGGVGPMTIAMLLSNTLLSFERRCAT